MTTTTKATTGTKPKPKVKTAPAHRGLDLSKAKKKQEEVESRSGTDFHELKEGWNYFYVLPPWSDEQVIWKEVQQHGRVGVCPRAAAGKDCILCDEIKKRARKGDTEFGENNRLRSRAFFNAIRKDDVKKMDPGCIKILALSPTMFQEVLDYITDEEKDISDPNAAVCLAVRRRGKGMRTRYKMKFGEAVDISKYITSKMLEGLFDLDIIRAAQPASIKDLRKAIRGTADDDDDETDERFEDEDDLEGEEDVEGAEEESEEDEVFDDPEEESEETEEETEEGEEAEEEPEEEAEEEPEEESEEAEEEPEEEEEESEEEEDDDEPTFEEEEEEEPAPKPKVKAKPATSKPVVKPKVKPSTKPAAKPAQKGTLAGKVKSSMKR